MKKVIIIGIVVLLGAIAAFIMLTESSTKVGMTEYIGVEVELDENFKPLKPKLKKANLNNIDADIEGELSGIGIEIGIPVDKLTVMRVMPYSNAEIAGIKVEDVIAEIDGEPTHGKDMIECANKIRGPIGSEIIIGILKQDGYEVRNVKVNRAKLTVTGLKLFKIIENKTAYIKLSSFMQGESETIRKLVEKGIKTGDLEKMPSGVILDLRNNLGGSLDSMVEIADLFLKNSIIATIEDSQEMKGNQWKANGKTLFPDEPIVVLINENTSQEAETLAAAFADNERAVVLGTASRGNAIAAKLKAKDQTEEPEVVMSYYIRQSGNTFHETGIIPHFIMEEDLAGRMDYETDPLIIKASEIVSSEEIYKELSQGPFDAE